MIARIVTIPLKPGTSLQYAQAIDKGVIPLIRTYRGFVDELALVTADGKFGLGISLWENKESAEAYNRAGYRDVMKALEPVVAGPAELKVYEVTNSTAHKIAAVVAA